MTPDAARPGPRRRSCMPPRRRPAASMKIGMSSKTMSLQRHVDDRLLDDPRAAPARPRRRQRRDLGRAPQADATVQVDPTRMRQHGVTLDQVMEATADSARRRAAALLERRDHRHRRLHRYAEPAARDPARAADRQRRPTWPRSRSTAAARQHGARSATSPTVDDRHQPLIGDAVINDGPGLLLVVEKCPWGNTLDVTRDVEEAIDELQPGLPGVKFDTHDLPAGELHRDLDPQPHARAADRLRCSSSWCSGRVPLRVADRADQPDRDPALADGGRARALLARRHDQHDGPGRAGDRPRGRRRRRDHRRREHPAPAAPEPRRGRQRSPIAKVILDASLEVRSPIVYATLIIVAVAGADLPAAGPHRHLLPPARAVLRAGHRRVARSWR